jgi:ATP-dependent Clp protease, protease subunit
MSETNQPEKYDAVLGGKNTPTPSTPIQPPSNGVVLGGLSNKNKMLEIETLLRQQRGQEADRCLRLLEERIIFLGQQVDDDLANLLIPQFLYLEAEDPNKDIFLYISSPGGSVVASLAIVDTMTQISPDVVTIGFGIAAGMGALLLTAGAKGKRFILPEGRIILTPTQGGTRPNVDLEIQNQELMESRNTIDSLLAKYTGQSQAKIQADTESDFYLSAAEALEYGLIDRLIDRPEHAGR